ncbi:MAG: hypothetical protein ACXWUU_09025 [Burkholderiales bacterium]
MFTEQKPSQTVKVRAAIAMHVCAWCVAAAIAYQALAEQPEEATPADAASPLVTAADLERAFWTCDYVATTRGVHAAPVALCSAVTAALQDQKFGGDFLELLDWWRRNKIAEHGRFQSVRLLDNSTSH